MSRRKPRAVYGVWPNQKRHAAVAHQRAAFVSHRCCPSPHISPHGSEAAGNKVFNSTLHSAWGSSARPAMLIDPTWSWAGYFWLFWSLSLYKAAVILSFRISWAVLRSQPSVLSTVRQRLTFKWKWKQHSKTDLTHTHQPVHVCGSVDCLVLTGYSH